MPTLYVLRHGIAEDHTPLGSDDERSLTQEGLEKMQQSAAAIVRLTADVELCLHSPLLRACQTAEIVQAARKQPLEQRCIEALRPSTSHQELLRYIYSLKIESILLVGHNPLLSILSSSLLGAHQGAVQLGKGTLVAIDHEPDSYAARLRWMIRSKELVRMSN